MIEQFNWEMFRYLWRLQGAYEPKPFPGRLHIFVSQFRPAGWLADSSLGWGRLAREGAEAVRSREITIQFSLNLVLAKPRTAGPDVSAIYSSWRHVYLEDGNFVPAGPVNTPRYEGKHPLMFCMYYAGLHHGACLIRRGALERVHGFDETLRSYEDADLLVRLAKDIGRFQFAPSSSPYYLWRLYKEQAREGGENTRYKLEDTAMNWIRVVKDASGNQQIGDILSSADDVMVWRQHCTSYARRLFERNAEAFKQFMEELRPVDPDFTYP